MKKRFVCFTTAAILTLGAAVPAMAAGVTATPNDASVAVDGKGIAIGAYNIGGYNYFKLRDIAAALNGTGANFEVGYDAAAKSIALSSKTAYSATGNELKDTAPTTKKTATVSNQKIILDGVEVSMQAYLIDGYNYFQLRELGKNLGFEVAWDNAAKAINMVTSSTPAAPVTPVAPKEETKVETDTQKLQKLIDETAEYGEIYLTESYKGIPGDTVNINKSLVFYGRGGVIENIKMIIDTDEQIWIDGLNFNGNKKAETAMQIKNAGADSAIVRCTFENYTGDAIVINKIVEGTKLPIARCSFVDFGLAEKKVDGAITLDAAAKMKMSFQIADNIFTLSKEVEEEGKMDIAFVTREKANAAEIYSETYVEFANNMIEKGANSWIGTDMYIDIPDANISTTLSN